MRKALLLFFIALLFFGCRKLDLPKNIHPENDIKTKISEYFKTNTSVNPTVKRVAEFLSQENATQQFAENLLKFDGVAIWDKSLIGFSEEINSQSLIQVAGNSISKPTGNFSHNDTIVIIPIVPLEKKFVYSFIKATVNKNKIRWKLYSGRDYKKYKNGRLDLNEVTQEKIASITMLLDYQTFGYTEFLVRDSNLFASKEKKILYKKITLKKNDYSPLNISNRSLVKSDAYEWRTFCYQIDYNHCPAPGNCYGASGSCDRCLSDCVTTVINCIEKLILLPDGGGGGGGGTVDNPPFGGGGGGGADGIPGNGDTADDPCALDSDCGRLGWTSAELMALNLTSDLSLSFAEKEWLEDHPERSIEMIDFLHQTNYSDLGEYDKVEIANAHLDNLINNPEYLAFVESVAASSIISQFSMIGLFKELAIEISFKIVKKYLPGYADWQSIKDAIDNANHGDWIGMLGEIINIAKKKVPFLAVFDAIYDAFNNGVVARAAWKVFDKIKAVPESALNGLITTMKSKCGGIIGNLVHDESMGSNSIQAFLKYNPNDAENFYRTLAQNIGVTVNNTSTPGRFYFDVGSYRFNYYPDATSVPHTNTIEIIFPNGGRYKLRFIN